MQWCAIKTRGLMGKDKNNISDIDKKVSNLIKMVAY